MTDDSGGRARRGARGRRRGRRPPADERFDDLDDWGQEPEDEDDQEPVGRRRRTPPRGRDASRRRGRSRGGDRGFDWAAADEEAGGEGRRYDEDDGYAEEAPRRRRSSRKPPGRKRLNLMDLCTPVFGYASILPQDAAGAHPGYQQFRDEVLAAVQAIEKQAAEHGIEIEDARQATYALCFFLDGQVAASEWDAKGQWAAEPLGIVLQQDAEGGVNFFKRLDSLGDRQRSVREVFLVCLALGFRGKYAELEATQQAAKIGEIRQKLVRSIHPVPMDKQPELFPEGYLPADPIEDEVPPPPRWWIWASLGTVAAALILYLVLFFAAGRTSKENERSIRNLVEEAALSLQQDARGVEEHTG